LYGAAVTSWSSREGIKARRRASEEGSRRLIVGEGREEGREGSSKVVQER